MRVLIPTWDLLTGWAPGTPGDFSVATSLDWLVSLLSDMCLEQPQP